MRINKKKNKWKNKWKKQIDLVGVNKDSYLVLDTLPAEYDSRVKAMEVDERPTEEYTDVGGLDVQIQELQVPKIIIINNNHITKQ